jgi:tRNA threonylcarbamoyladenosine dehydratase
VSGHAQVSSPDRPVESGTAPALGSEAEFYAELVTRNAGVVDDAPQRLLREARVLVAGCGSIGGAAVEPLTRLGVRRLVLADPGEYELNNLNRQNATVADVGRNKAEVAAERVRAINPFAEPRVYPQGVAADVVEELLEGVDAIVDGVDVTTMSGLRAKFLLHEHAAARRLPLVTGWDMAGAQYVRCYDYRRIRRVFDGQLEATDLDRLTMWQLLERVVPVRYVPLEMIEIARANLGNPSFSFPQLVYAADVFGALAAHVVAQMVAGEPVRDHVYVDLHERVRPPRERWRARVRRPLLAAATVARVRLGRASGGADGQVKPTAGGTTE